MVLESVRPLLGGGSATEKSRNCPRVARVAPRRGAAVPPSRESQRRRLHPVVPPSKVPGTTTRKFGKKSSQNRYIWLASTDSQSLKLLIGARKNSYLSAVRANLNIVREQRLHSISVEKIPPLHQRREGCAAAAQSARRRAATTFPAARAHAATAPPARENNPRTPAFAAAAPINSSGALAAARISSCTRATYCPPC